MEFLKKIFPGSENVPENKSKGEDLASGALAHGFTEEFDPVRKQNVYKRETENGGVVTLSAEEMKKHIDLAETREDLSEGN
jgi:hypothetical protein